MNKSAAKDLLKFIEKSPSTFHVIAQMEEILNKEGLTKLRENDQWKLQKGKGYYVVRNDSSIIAFKIPENGVKGYQIMASHSDSPSFKIKENPEMEVESHYIKLNVEKYGGMVFHHGLTVLFLLQAEFWSKRETKLFQSLLMWIET